jgi:periplasmic protein TonB
MSSYSDKPSFFAAYRNVVIAGSVLLFHALAIWALQTGLLMRAVEIIVPVEVLAQIVELPTPKTAPPVPVATPSLPVKKAETKPMAAAQPVIQTAPPILTVNEPAPAAAAFVAPAPQLPAPIAPASVPVAVIPAPAAVSKAPTPTCTEDYISQPDPLYPSLSARMGEQGVASVRVLFSPTGLPLAAELIKSTGFERLDKVALEGAKRWRFVSCRSVVAATDHWESTTVGFKLK